MIRCWAIMKQASHIVLPCTFVGHYEEGHTLNVSLCPVIMSWPYTHMTCDSLFGRCEAGHYIIRLVWSRPHTFLGRFEAGHTDYVSFCSAILKQAILFTCNIGRPLQTRSRTHYVWHMVRSILRRPHAYLLLLVTLHFVRPLCSLP